MKGSEKIENITGFYACIINNQHDNIRKACNHPVLAGIINSPMNIDMPDGGNVQKSPLLYALYFQNSTAETVKLLLELGADPSYIDSRRNSILSHIANKPIEYQAIVMPAFLKSLEDNGLSLHNFTRLKNNEGENVLHIAASCVDDNLVQLFMDNGGDITIKDNMGNNAMHYCIKSYKYAVEQNVEDAIEGIIPMMQLLAKKGCNPETPNNAGEVPLRNFAPAQQVILKSLYEKSQRDNLNPLSKAQQELNRRENKDNSCCNIQ